MDQPGQIDHSLADIGPSAGIATEPFTGGNW